MFWWMEETVRKRLSGRCSVIEQRLDDVDRRLFHLELSEKDFRDKVLRKIQKQKESESSEEAKDLYNGVLISDK